MKRKIFTLFLVFGLLLNFLPINQREVVANSGSFENPEYIELLDQLIDAETKYGLSGAQLAIYHEGKLVKSSAYGYINNYRNVKNNEETVLGKHEVIDELSRIKVTPNTLFDLASNTKMYATVYSIQKLVSEGKIDLDTKISDVFPEFLDFANENGWKEKIDLRMVLSHRAGFAPDPQYHNEKYDEVNWAFTVQEEPGLRGARTTTNIIKPDIAFAIDTTLAGDTPFDNNSVRLGEGVVLSMIDSNTLAHRGLIKWIEKLCGYNKIKFQYAVFDKGGTDSGNIHKSLSGVINMTLSIPIRYMHTNNSIVHEDDVEECIKLVNIILEELNWDTYQKIVEA